MKQKKVESLSLAEIVKFYALPAIAALLSNIEGFFLFNQLADGELKLPAIVLVISSWPVSFYLVGLVIFNQTRALKNYFYWFLLFLTAVSVFRLSANIGILLWMQCRDVLYLNGLVVVLSFMVKFVVVKIQKRKQPRPIFSGKGALIGLAIFVGSILTNMIGGVVYGVYRVASDFPTSWPRNDQVVSSPTPFFQEEVQEKYKVTVDKNVFIISDKVNNLVLAEYKYRPDQIPESLLDVNEHFVTQDVILFYVGPFPAGCTNDSLPGCAEFLGKIISEYTQYGGLWRYNLVTKKFELFVPVPKGDVVRLVDIYTNDPEDPQDLWIYLKYEINSAPGEDGQQKIDKVVQFISPIYGLQEELVNVTPEQYGVMKK